MREFSLYSTQSLLHTVLLIFVPFRLHSVYTTPNMVIKPIKPIKAVGLPGRRASLGRAQACLGSEDHWAYPAAWSAGESI